MTLTSDIEYKVTHKGLETARKICAKMDDQKSRKRAFKALLCLDALADYLFLHGIEVDISRNLYKIFPINKEFEFTDLHCRGRFIDVLPVANDNYVLIPKKHSMYGIIPDMYVVADYNQITHNVKFLGCIEGNKVDKTKQIDGYFVMETSQLKPPTVLEEMLNEEKPLHLTNENHSEIASYFIDYLDGTISDDNKQQLLLHLIECKACRNVLTEFFDYETIAKQTQKYPEVFNDSTLDIVGAAAVNDEKHKNFKEVTIEIDKEPDEYEEDEQNQQKSIRSAIEDPLQMLYKNNNSEIFDILGEAQKAAPKSIIDAILTEKEQHKEEAKETPKPTGNINPKYYAEDLSDGLDTLENETKIITDTDKIEQKIENKVLEDLKKEIKEEVKEEVEKELKLEKGQEETPNFKNELDGLNTQKMSASDESLLLGEETKTVDKPDFANDDEDRIKILDEPEDDLLLLNEEEEEKNNEFPQLDVPEPKNELPTAMDGVVYIDKDEKAETYTQDDELNILDTEQNDVAPTELEDTNEISEDELTHFDAVDIDIIDEDDEYKETEPAPIPKNIAAEGLAASSLLDYEEENNVKPLPAAKDDEIINVSDDDISEINITPLNASVAINPMAILNTPAEEKAQKQNVEEENYDDLLFIDENEDETQPKTSDNNDLLNLDDDSDDLVLLDEGNKTSNDDLLVLDDKKEPETSDDDDLILLDDNEEQPTAPKSVEPQADDDMLILDDEDDNNDLVLLDDDKKEPQTSDDDDLILLDDNDEQPTAPQNVEPQADDDMLILDDEDNNNDLVLLDDDKKEPEKSDDDLILLDDNDEQPTAPKSVEPQADDDMLILDDEDKSDNLVINDEPEKSDDDDFVILDDNEEEQTQSNADLSLEPAASEDLTLSNEKETQPITEELSHDDSDLLSLDGEEELGTLGDIDTLAPLGELEEPDILIDEPAEVVEDVIQPIEEETPQKQYSEDDLLYYDGDAIEQPKQQVEDSAPQETVLPDYDLEIPDITIPDEDTNEYQETEEFVRPQGAMISDEEDDDDDIILIDDEDTEMPVSTASKPTAPTQPVIEEDEDDDLVFIDDDEEKEQEDFVRPASVQDADFARPASVTFSEQQELKEEQEEELQFITDEEKEEMQNAAPTVQNDDVFDIPDEEENVEFEKEEAQDLQISNNEGFQNEPEYDEEEYANYEDNQQSEYEEKAEEQPQYVEEPQHAPQRMAQPQPVIQPDDSDYEEEYDDDEEYEDDDDEEYEDEEEEKPKNIFSRAISGLTNLLKKKNEDEEDDEEYEDDDDEEYEDEEEEPQKQAPSPYAHRPYTKIQKQYDELQLQYAKQQEQYNQQNEIAQQQIQQPQEAPQPTNEQYEQVQYSNEPENYADQQQYAQQEEYTDEEQQQYSEQSMPAPQATQASADDGDDIYGDDEEYEDDVDDEDEEYEDEEEEEGGDAKKKALVKKAVIALVAVVLLAGIGFGAKTIISNNNSQQETMAENADMMGDMEEPAGGIVVPDDNNVQNTESEPPLPMPTEGESADATQEEAAPPISSIQPNPATPKAGTSNATTEDMNKAVANAFSDNPSAVSVRKTSWGVNATMASNPEIKQYLQATGKNIQSAIQRQVCSMKGVSVTGNTKVQILISENGTLQDAMILKSSGNTEIDSTVLQSIKQIISASALPTSAVQSVQQQTGSKTIKMSLTVTF